LVTVSAPTAPWFVLASSNVKKRTIVSPKWIALGCAIGLFILIVLDPHIALQYREWSAPISLVLLIGLQIYVNMTGMLRSNKSLLLANLITFVFLLIALYVVQLAVFWILCFATWGACSG
jgi:hypothetical protein